MKKIVFFLLIFMATQAYGQVVSQNIYPYLDIRSIISFDVTVSGKGLEYYFRNSEQISGGLRGNNVFRAVVKSNQNWIMNVHADSPVFLEADTFQPSTMPCNILGIRQENKDDFLKVETYPQTIATGFRGSEKRKGNTFALDLDVTPGDAAEAGEYCINLVFTITAD